MSSIRFPLSGTFLGFFLLIAVFAANAQTTSWRGTTSVAWANAANWTNGVPTASTDAVLGDANFVGAFQPSITATSVCNSLTVGGGVTPITLTANSLLTASADVNILPNGTLRHTASSVSLRGNWSNTGTYTPVGATVTVVFSAAGAQAINSPTTFNRVTINNGSTTSLNASITITGIFTVSGIFDTVSDAHLVTLTGATFTLNSTAQIRVHAATFLGSFSVLPTTINATSTIDYASSTINQTVAALNYGRLVISGGMVKSLEANTTTQSVSATGGRVTVSAGTLDLGVFTLDRDAPGAGIFTISNGATLIIGGTNSFPINYTTTTIGATSTVTYGGNDQTVAADTYGHLVLSGTSGVVTKTLPITNTTIAGDLISTVGTATSVSFAATAILTVGGNVSIGASTTFHGGTVTHPIAGNWANEGTFDGSTGTVRFNGAARVISGAGAHNFNNLTIAGAGVTSSAPNLTLTGNLATTGAGTFTHNTGGTLTMSGAPRTIGGAGIVLANLVISGTVSTTASFTIDGDLTTTGTFNATAGTITLSGATSIIGGAGTTTFYALAVSGTPGTADNFSIRSNISGTGTLTATGGTITFIGTSIVTGTHDLFNVTINGTRLQLGANATLGVGGALTITAGSFNSTTTPPNTLAYNGPGNQNITVAIYNNLTLAGGGTKTSLGTTTYNGNVTIESGATFDAATFTHNIAGNWINNGTFVPSTSAVVLNGANNVTTSGVTTFNTLTLNKTTAATTVSLDNDISATTVTMTQGRMLTGSNSVTITGTRTGSAVILGTIIRTHAFAANTSYAFETNFNTINFTTITGGSVTSVSVTVLSEPVGDFPSSASIDRSYDISVTHTGTYAATLRLHYADTELNSNVEANLNLWHFDTGAWTGMGRQSSDATSNWVQRTALADITGRWTLYDGPSTVIWKGTVSTSWTNAANWKAGVAPVSNDDVFIGTESFTSQPSITTAVAATSITLGSAQSVVLTVGGTTGALTVSGNVTGDWTGDRTHTINVGSRTLTVAGALTLSNGSALRAIQLNVSSGTISLGTLNQPAGGVTFSSTGTLNIGADYNHTGGAFNAGVGTVNYNGSADQVIAGVTYNTLNISKPSGTASLSNAAVVNGALAISGSCVVNTTAPIDLAGNLTIGTGTELTADNTTLNIGGNWSNAGAFNALGGSVVFDGAGTQTIDATTFNNLVISKGGVASLAGDLVIDGDLSVTSGTLDLGEFLANRSTPGGEFTLSTGSTLLVAGSNFPTNYLLSTLSTVSSVVYYGTSPQDVAAVTYGNLVLSNGGGSPKTLMGDTQVNGGLTINSGSTLDASAALLTLGGDWVNDGTSIGSNNVDFIGAATQTVGGSAVTDFNNVNVTNTSSPGVSIESSQNLLGVLTLGASASVDADGTANTSILRLLSSADNPTQDASIATLPAGAAVSGNVTVQRYMTIEGVNGGRIFRYISSPVQNATVADMQNEIPVTGDFTGTSVCELCGTDSSLFYYDEAITTGGIDGGYRAFPEATNTETFLPGRGYAMLVRGPSISTAQWDLRGPINSGPISLPVSLTSSGIPADDGWNLVGNPYPSTIDWEAPTGWTKTNIDGTFYIRDNGNGGQYATWNGVVGTNGGSQYIATGQAFLVRANAASPSLSVDEDVKVAGTQTNFIRKASPDNLVRITLAQGDIRDEAIIHFRQDATEDFDGHADAFKFPNTGFNLSTQWPGKDKLAINSLAFSSASVNLALDNVEAGNYSFSFGNLDTFMPSATVTLIDAFTGTETDVRANNSYPFVVTGSAGSSGNSRFSLRFTGMGGASQGSETAGVESGGTVVKVYPNPVNDVLNFQYRGLTVADVQVINMSGQVAGKFTLSNQGGETTGRLDMSSMASGVYVVEIKTLQATERIKVWKK